MPQPSVETPRQPARPQTGNRSWSFLPDSQPHHYSSVVTTLLELRTDTGTTKESLETTTDFTLAFSRSSSDSVPVRVTGSIDGLRLKGNGRTGQDTDFPFRPFSFSGQIDSGSLSLDSAGGAAFQIITACDSIGLNAVTGLNRNIVVLPRVVSTGMTWTDSSTVPGCSGGIPIQLTAVKSYRVIGETGTPGTIEIGRNDRVRAVGEGAQGQHRVMIQAAGTGSARILIDRSSGMLSQMEGEQKTDVIVTASGRSQHFIQAVREKTVAIQ